MRVVTDKSEDKMKIIKKTRHQSSWGCCVRLGKCASQGEIKSESSGENHLWQALLTGTPIQHHEFSAE